VIISLIVAMDEEGGIGKVGKLPWHLRTDLQRFKQVTMGRYLIQGRKTYETIGRPLPGRKMVVITRNVEYEAPGCQVALSLADALALAEQAGESEAFIGGGGEIFAQVLPLANRLYLTCVQTHAGCEVFFPPFEMGEWKEEECTFQPSDEENDYQSIFRMLIRK
jgi:dihydrofolate reductase